MWRTTSDSTTGLQRLSPNTRARAYFAAGSFVAALGVGLAAARVPGGFDWVYTVISHLGSRRKNPDGAQWLTGSLLVTALLLWPVVTHLRRIWARDGILPGAAVGALRLGLTGAVLLAFEGLLDLDLSRIHRKGHEILALVTFLSLYGGVLGLHAHRIRRAAATIWPGLMVVLPLCAVGVSQLVLYLSQRDLGWVNTAWRDMGIPFWLSFAFWQWLAVAFLGLGLGALLSRHDRVPDG